jgi:methylase of polypeptide subunit release factors
MRTIAEILRKNGFEKIETFRDLAGRERVIGGKQTDTARTTD